MRRLDPTSPRSLILALMLAVAGCGAKSTPTQAEGRPERDPPAPATTTEPPACSVDADCATGQTCNCRCLPGLPCDGPADACGDCRRLNMGGVCLASCEGG